MMPLSDNAHPRRRKSPAEGNIRLAAVEPDPLTDEQASATLPVPAGEEPRKRPAHPQKILVIDIGGTYMKVLATDQEKPRKTRSGRLFTPQRMVEAVRDLTGDWPYEAISLGLPALVDERGPMME